MLEVSTFLLCKYFFKVRNTEALKHLPPKIILGFISSYSQFFAINSQTPLKVFFRDGVKVFFHSPSLTNIPKHSFKNSERGFQGSKSPAFLQSFTVELKLSFASESASKSKILEILCCSTKMFKISVGVNCCVINSIVLSGFFWQHCR